MYMCIYIYIYIFVYLFIDSYMCIYIYIICQVRRRECGLLSAEMLSLRSLGG